MNKIKYLLMLSVAFVAFSLTSCNDDDEYFDSKYQSREIVVNKIYLEDYESSIPDREVTFARLGQMIRVEGSGLYGMKQVLVNGYDTYFNRTYVADNSMLITLNESTPIANADESVRDKITFVKDKTQTTIDFEIKAAAPTIKSISNTLPQAGEEVIVYGKNLHETQSIELPGGIAVDVYDCDDVDGEWYSFIMPEGVTESGSILSEGTNGSAKTPEFFNFGHCMLLDFDTDGQQSAWSWSEDGSMIDETDLVDDPAGSGRGKCFQLIPERLIAKGGIDIGKPRATECWTQGDGYDEAYWDGWMYDYIDPETSLEEMAIQFDILVSPDEPWTTCGQLEILVINNYNLAGIGSDDDNASCLVAFYVPYIVNGEITKFSTNGWETVSIPFSQVNKYANAIADGDKPTFADLNEDRDAATYPNFGMGFVNTDFEYGGLEIESEKFATHIYIDNWRVVPYKFFTVSDYPEDDEE